MVSNMEKRYSISDASRQVEVENHVLRYWEEELALCLNVLTINSRLATIIFGYFMIYI